MWANKKSLIKLNDNYLNLGPSKKEDLYIIPWENDESLFLFETGAGRIHGGV